MHPQWLGSFPVYFSLETCSRGLSLYSTWTVVLLILWHMCSTMCYLLCFSEYAEKLFDMVDNFAESSKRKAAVWPLQIMLLILCPVRKFCYYCTHVHVLSKLTFKPHYPHINSPDWYSYISLEISWEILIKDQSIFFLVIIWLILVTISLSNICISLGENWWWSLLGLKGLIIEFKNNVWTLTICMENPGILGRIQMERFIPVEILWKISNTFWGITFFLFLPKWPKFSVPFVWIASARLPVERKRKIYQYFVNGTTQSRSCFWWPQKIPLPFDRNFSPKLPYKW